MKRRWLEEAYRLCGKGEFPDHDYVETEFETANALVHVRAVKGDVIVFSATMSETIYHQLREGEPVKQDEVFPHLCDHQGPRFVKDGVVYCFDCSEALQVWGGPNDGESLIVDVFLEHDIPDDSE